MLRLVPTLLSCGKASNALTPQMISASLLELINCIGSETESTYLTSHLTLFTDSLKLVGGPPVLPLELRDSLMKSMKRQLDRLTDRRKNGRPPPQIDLGFDFGTMDEDMETFALKRMQILLYYLDSNHPLLARVSSVMAMGQNLGTDHLASKLQAAIARLDSMFGF